MPDANRLSELNAALDDFLHTRELEEGRELPPEAPTLEDRRAALDDKYWAAVRQVVSAVAENAADGPLPLEDTERALLDFGVFPHPALEDIRSRLDTGSKVDGVLLMHESLNAVVDDVLRRDAIAEYRADYDALAHDIALWPNTHLAHIRYRDDKVRELLGESPRCSHVLKLLADVDEKLEQYKRLETRDATGRMSNDDQKSWATIRHYVESRLKEANSILTPPVTENDSKRNEAAAAAFASIESVQASVAHLIELHEKQRGLEQQILEQQSAARRVTSAELVKMLNRELSSVAGLLRLAARYARVTECAVPINEAVDYIDADRAAEAMQRMLRFDPKLIDNPMAARFGPPELLLAPGVGDGVFDASRNRWVVPQRCFSSTAESLAQAAILYRLEVDANQMKKALLSSYRESIPANRDVRANLKLRSSLIRDYINWITLETYGEEVLPRDTRNWFERHIAPSKTEPWQPPEYRGMNAYQLKAELKELNELSESAENEYRAGVVEWRLAGGDPQVYLERAVPRLTRALELNGEHHAATYSIGILYMQLGDFQRAITAFRRFTELVPCSWWSRKAIELCAQCR
ncbi:MAG: hypothetical protein KDB32_11060 [Planctomycetes bacterium]|nr:hypothetical protein [Planctomycetota bacterium]